MITVSFFRRLVLYLAAALLVVAAGEARADHPPTPDEERAALRLADPSLTVELVAAEPAVASPVAMAWDEQGRLYVVEMTDYPVAPDGGRIKRLEDRDGDGRYEHATVFADKLHWPTGVLPWNGGILVTAAPDLLFFKDTDGDGRADVRSVILTGFAEGNQQLRVNSPTWGIDNAVYLANGRSGGAVRRPADPPGKAVPIPRNDVCLDPATGSFAPSLASASSASLATTGAIGFLPGTRFPSVMSCSSHPTRRPILGPWPRSLTWPTAGGSTRSLPRNAGSTPRPSPISMRAAVRRSTVAICSAMATVVMRLPANRSPASCSIGVSIRSARPMRPGESIGKRVRSSSPRRTPGSAP